MLGLLQTQEQKAEREIESAHQRINADSALQLEQIGNMPLPQFLRGAQRDNQSANPSLFTCYLQDSEACSQWGQNQGAIQNALRAGDPERALEIAREAYQQIRSEVGISDDATAVMAGWVGRTANLSAQRALSEGRLDDARALLLESATMETEAAQSMAAVFGPLHPSVIYSAKDAADAFHQLADLTEDPELKDHYLSQAADRLDAVHLAMSTRWSNEPGFVKHHRGILDELIEISEEREDDNLKRFYEEQREALLERVREAGLNTSS